MTIRFTFSEIMGDEDDEKQKSQISNVPRSFLTQQQASFILDKIKSNRDSLKIFTVKRASKNTIERKQVEVCT